MPIEGFRNGPVISPLLLPTCARFLLNCADPRRHSSTVILSSLEQWQTELVRSEMHSNMSWNENFFKIKTYQTNHRRLIASSPFMSSYRYRRIQLIHRSRCVSVTSRPTSRCRSRRNRRSESTWLWSLSRFIRSRVGKWLVAVRKLFAETTEVLYTFCRSRSNRRIVVPASSVEPGKNRIAGELRGSEVGSGHVVEQSGHREVLAVRVVPGYDLPHDDADTVDIGLRVVRLAAEDLGSHGDRGASVGSHRLMHVGERAEVAQLHGPVAIREQHVLQLQVSVHLVVWMKEVDGAGELVHPRSKVVYSVLNVFSGVYQVSHAATIHVFHDDSTAVTGTIEEAVDPGKCM